MGSRLNSLHLALRTPAEDQMYNLGSAAKPPVFGIESTALGNAQIGNDTFSPIGRFDFRRG